MSRAAHDAIVVGGGACGILAARLLTGAGLRVLLLDAGPDIRTQAAAGGGRQPIQSHCWRCAGEFAELFVDDDRHPYTTADEGEGFLWIRGRQLGGRMVAWSGIAARLTDADFAPLLPDHPRWPIRYADLARYYDVAEQALGVEAACAVDERTGRYVSAYAGAWPPSAERLRSAVEAIWPDRQVLRRPSSATPNGSWKGVVEELPLFQRLGEAERSGRLTVRSHATVTSVCVDEETGLAGRVAARDSRSGAPLQFRSAVVLLCASTIETTRLLLNSRSARHPAGLGNRSGVLGRCLMEHAVGVSVTGCQPALRGGGDVPVPLFPLLVPRYRNVTARSPGFAGGYWWQGYALRAAAGAGSYDAVHLSAFAEVQPRPENRVRLREDRRDACGVPLAHISYSVSDNERRMIADMLDSGCQMLAAGGFEVVRTSGEFRPSGLSIHEVGTARMGSDPRSSVLNPHNQIWDCENVYVTDGSAFASGGSLNPTLTMLALTARACDRIAQAAAAPRPVVRGARAAMVR